jgi:TolB-like protein/Flp pilus assembly protein TadD
LEEYDEWRPLLHQIGECEVKHGARVSVSNLCSEEIGNPAVPEKLKAVRAAAAAAQRKRAAFRWLSLSTLGLLAATAVIAFLSVRYAPRFASTALAVPEKSIAVLPFENLSRDPDNAYFATGVQNEILTRLAKIAALKVISHTSTQQYASRPGNLSEIARQLGVANILEGSVQKAANQVHINAQLIRAATGEHLWAESYDRKLENIFGVEAEVATAVAEALKAKLTGSEQKALEQKPTNNPEAYDNYLRGIAYSVHLDWSEKDILAAINCFRKAVQLDPMFALAWGELAHQAALGYFNQIGVDFPALAEEAKRAANKAVSLQPNLAESRLAQGYWHYYGERDFDRAIEWFEKARKVSPKNSQTLEALALVYRRKGEWQRSLEYFQQAVELDPRNVALLSDQADTLAELRQYAKAIEAYDRLLNMMPGEQHALAGKVGVYQDVGDLSASAALLAPLHPAMSSELFQAQIDQWTYERRYGEAIAALKNALEKPDPAATDWIKIDTEAHLAWLQQVSGDSATARGAWMNVRSKLEQLRRSKRKDFGVWALASAYVALGEKEKAFAIVKEGTAVFAASKDAMVASFFPSIMARIAVQAGEKDLALEQLVASAQLPTNYITYGSLKFNPEWDLLRGDPRFEKIVTSLAPKESLPK